jgi:hypothetical protein
VWNKPNTVSTLANFVGLGALHCVHRHRWFAAHGRVAASVSAESATLAAPGDHTKHRRTAGEQRHRGGFRNSSRRRHIIIVVVKTASSKQRTRRQDQHGKRVGQLLHHDLGRRGEDAAA